MIETVARVPTSRAATYVMGFCRHWPDRLEIDFRERQGVLHFDNAVATLTPRPNELVVTILANDIGTAEQLQVTVSAEINRFANSERPLQFDWQLGRPHAL